MHGPGEDRTWLSRSPSRPYRMTATRRIDYSVYLVTGRDLLPPGKDYYESLDESLRDGHVTVVQLREKHADTIDFIELAKKSLAICDKVGGASCYGAWRRLTYFLNSTMCPC